MNIRAAQTMIFACGMMVVFPVQVRAAQMNLEAEKTSFAVGETINVNVNLSGGEPTVGTDLVLTYDPKAVQILGVEENKLYPVYNPTPSSRVNAATGMIKMSGSANFGQPITADGTFAMVKVKGLSAGTTSLSLSYKKGSTTLSGVLGKDGQELLSVVPKPIQLTISGTSTKTKQSQTDKNIVFGFFQNIATSVSRFFSSLFSWVK